MAVNLKQNADGSMGLQGPLLDEGGFISVNLEWNASTVDKCGFIAQRVYRVKGIVANVEVVGTDGGAVTIAVKKAPSGTDIAAGTALHTGTINAKGTVDTNQTLTLSATDGDLTLAVGDRIGLDETGVMTAAIGAVTVLLAVA